MHHHKGLLFLLVKIFKEFDYVSVSSKPDHPPGVTLGIFRTFPLPGVLGFRPTFLARSLGFRIREIFYIVQEEKCRNFSIRFKETGGRMKSRCSCAVSYQCLQKQWISTVSLITQTVFGHFDKIFRSSPRSFLQMLFHHQNFESLHRKVYRSHSVCFKAIPLGIFIYCQSGKP